EIPGVAQNDVCRQTGHGSIVIDPQDCRLGIRLARRAGRAGAAITRPTGGDALRGQIRCLVKLSNRCAVIEIYRHKLRRWSKNCWHLGQTRQRWWTQFLRTSCRAGKRQTETEPPQKRQFFHQSCRKNVRTLHANAARPYSPKSSK